MKLFVLKLLSLLVLLTGLAILGVALNFPALLQGLEYARGYLGGQPGGFNWILLVLGGVLTVLGFYALIPRLRGGRRTIAFMGDHGEVNIQVDRAEATLKRVISAMPEVKSAKVWVEPTKDRRRAVISADAVVYNQTDAPARQTFDLINHLIEETATDVLGLEIEQPIHLRITGTDVDAQAASEALHQRVARANVAPAGAAAVASANSAGYAASPTPVTEPSVPAAGNSETPQPILQEQEHLTPPPEAAPAPAYTAEAMEASQAAPHVVESPEVGVGPAVIEAEEEAVERTERAGEPGATNEDELRFAPEVEPIEEGVVYESEEEQRQAGARPEWPEESYTTPAEEGVVFKEPDESATGEERAAEEGEKKEDRWTF